MHPFGHLLGKLSELISASMQHYLYYVATDSLIISQNIGNVMLYKINSQLYEYTINNVSYMTNTTY